MDFIMLVGLPASGKSTIAKSFKEQGYKIYSSDELRLELYGEYTQNHNYEVFNELHNRIKDSLDKGESCVYDATNISRRRRTTFLKEISKYNCEKRVIWVATSKDVCKSRNIGRDNEVPSYVIDRMAKTMESPIPSEGWDSIVVF